MIVAPRIRQMSLVSLARMAGLTGLSLNRPSSLSRSMLEADISMMSTMSCRTMARIWSRNSSRVR